MSSEFKSFYKFTSTLPILSSPITFVNLYLSQLPSNSSSEPISIQILITSVSNQLSLSGLRNDFYAIKKDPNNVGMFDESWKVL